SGSRGRLPPEPARSRSRRACAKRPGLFMMSTVGAEAAPDTAAASVGAPCVSQDRRRRSIRSHRHIGVSDPPVFAAPHWVGPGTLRHWAAAQQFGRFRSEADIEPLTGLDL